MKFVLSSVLLLAVCLSTLTQADTAVPAALAPNPFDRLRGHIFTAYFRTWDEVDVDDAKDTKLAAISPAINVVNLAFISPGAVYKGDGNLDQTGFDYDGDQLRAVMKLMRARNPQMKFLVSVGGWGAD